MNPELEVMHKDNCEDMISKYLYENIGSKLVFINSKYGQKFCTNTLTEEVIKEIQADLLQYGYLDNPCLLTIDEANILDLSYKIYKFRFKNDKVMISFGYENNNLNEYENERESFDITAFTIKIGKLAAFFIEKYEDIN